MNLLKKEWRAQVIKDISSDENKKRKQESQKRFTVYNDGQRPYVLEQLTNEFGAEVVKEMRTCTSINITKRVVNSQASIYKNPPNRTFTPKLEGNAEKQVAALYADSEFDVQMKDANKKFKLHQQCALQIVPLDGHLVVKALRPHHYDVVPDPRNPEKAYALVLSGYGSWYERHLVVDDIQGQGEVADGVDQTIGDPDDRAQAEIVQKEGRVFVWWSDEYHFRTDESGNILDGDEIDNPIGELPFIDIAAEKDNTFWTEAGSSAVAFNLDFSTVLSDTCNTNRLQGYAQAVITSVSAPADMKVGPNRVLWLKMDPNRPEMKPSFGFESPAPDLASSLNLQDRLLSYYLTAEGMDPKKVNGTGSTEKFASGYERLLAMLQEFEASEDDYSKFKKVEQKAFALMVAWSNILQGTDGLVEELQHGQVDESTQVAVEFQGPEVIKTQAEKEDSVIKRMEAKLLSQVAAYMELYGVDENQAKEAVEKINAEAIAKQKGSVQNGKTESSPDGQGSEAEA